MLKVSNLSLTYSGELLFNFERGQLVLNPGDRFAVVGPNGAGKSSLLNVIAGLTRPTSGTVTIGPSDRIGYLGQQVDAPDSTLGNYLHLLLADINELQEQMHRFEDLMTHPELASASDPGPDEVLRLYGVAQSRYDELGGWTYEATLETVLQHLGIAHLDLNTHLRHLSGGEQSRVLMAGVLLARPTILLLDEPTNHLDAAGIDWLSGYLREFKGAVLVVSHDRQFLNDTVTRIYELDGIEDEPQVYEGNYDFYEAEKQLRREKIASDFTSQDKDRKRRERDILKTMEGAQQRESETHDSAQRRLAAKVAKKSKVRQRRLKKEMERIDWIRRPETRPTIDLTLAGLSTLHQRLLQATGVSVSIPGRTLLGDFSLRISGQDRILVTGDNGCGKTTLLRALVGITKPESGSVERYAEIGYLPQVHHDLPMDMPVLKYFRSRVPMYEDEARSWLNRFLFEQYQLRQPIGKLSAGERTRLMLGILMLSGAELLILDEPSNNLDFDSLDVLEEALRNFRGTLVVVTHDRYFADRIGITRTIHLSKGATTASA